MGGAKTHNLFNYFPNHASESIVAHANDRFNKNKSPHLMRAPIDDRTEKYLSRQNVHNLGTKPLKSSVTKPKQHMPMNNIDEIAQALFDDDGLFGADSMKFVKSKTIKTKKKKKTTTEAEIESDESAKNNELTTESADDSNEEYEEVEIEFYSNFDDDELGETVDRVISQLVASYLDNESGEEVDVSAIFANELMEEVNLDEATLSEMSDLLNMITENGQIGNGDGEDEENGDSKIFAFKFVVETESESDASEEIESETLLESKGNENNVDQNEVIAV